MLYFFHAFEEKKYINVSKESMLSDKDNDCVRGMRW